LSVYNFNNKQVDLLRIRPVQRLPGQYQSLSLTLYIPILIPSVLMVAIV